MVQELVGALENMVRLCSKETTDDLTSWGFFASAHAPMIGGGKPPQGTPRSTRRAHPNFGTTLPRRSSRGNLIEALGCSSVLAST